MERIKGADGALQVSVVLIPTRICIHTGELSFPSVKAFLVKGWKLTQSPSIHWAIVVGSCLQLAPSRYCLVARNLPSTASIRMLPHLQYGIQTAFLLAELIHPGAVLAALQDFVEYMITGGKACFPIQVIGEYPQNSIAGTSASGEAVRLERRTFFGLQQQKTEQQPFYEHIGNSLVSVLDVHELFLSRVGLDLDNEKVI